MTLTDTQTLLLAHAARNDAGSLYPLPSTLSSAAGAARSIVALVKRGLTEEREVVDADVLPKALPVITGVRGWY